MDVLHEKGVELFYREDFNAYRVIIEESKRTNISENGIPKYLTQYKLRILEVLDYDMADFKPEIGEIVECGREEDTYYHHEFGGKWSLSKNHPLYLEKRLFEEEINKTLTNLVSRGILNEAFSNITLKKK